ncbi:hypothetical protein HMPREF1544_01830 [Mucor circinelloides 1006PhL]|uniref:UBX domain-containing protein 2 n=1 Tax=Mucor circinelloides f. circinelloides (strain 1006PhL) TaxID=1220926 RepID=S2K7C9_MUCC1|nr:hypothetical protein HMPREF1544_01830 [Mucor circinelloides 1006PhL]
MSQQMAGVWFSGPVAEAVKTVTEKNLVFLVYLYDDSEDSKQLDSVFQDENLVTVMKEKTIALKMPKDSQEAKLFGQLYPTYQVPVVYFIIQGTIKDYGIQSMKSEDVIEKINKFSPAIDAKKKLQDVRKKRLAEEEKRAREREIKRREDGKLAQETQQALQDKQNRLHIEKVKKERKADEEYKKKVKEQIAKDRADQIAARKAEKQRLEEHEKQEQHTTRLVGNSSSRGYYDHSNLNIKQLDGSSLRYSFSSSNTLASVTEWIDTVRTDGDTPYKLFAQFPNRNFDIGDEQRTLLELKLCPSGTLIMKPIKNASTAYAGASSSSTLGSGGWMNYLYSATDALYNSVSQVGTSVANYLVTPTATPEHGRRLGGNGGQQSSTREDAPAPSSSNRNVNILHSKRFDNDKDDKRQTYNGNSVNHE